MAIVSALKLQVVCCHRSLEQCLPHCAVEVDWARCCGCRMCTLPVSLEHGTKEVPRRGFEREFLKGSHEALLVQWRGFTPPTREPPWQLLDTTHFLCFCAGLVKRPGAEICRKFFVLSPNSEFVVIDIGEWLNDDSWWFDMIRVWDYRPGSKFQWTKSFLDCAVGFLMILQDGAALELKDFCQTSEGQKWQRAWSSWERNLADHVLVADSRIVRLADWSLLCLAGICLLTRQLGGMSKKLLLAS